jgi:hypothetical protein
MPRETDGHSPKSSAHRPRVRGAPVIGIRSPPGPGRPRSPPGRSGGA